MIRGAPRAAVGADAFRADVRHNVGATPARSSRFLVWNDRTRGFRFALGDLVSGAGVGRS